MGISSFGIVRSASRSGAAIAGSDYAALSGMALISLPGNRRNRGVAHNIIELRPDAAAPRRRCRLTRRRVLWSSRDLPGPPLGATGSNEHRFRAILRSQELRRQV